MLVIKGPPKRLLIQDGNQLLACNFQSGRRTKKEFSKRDGGKFVAPAPLIQYLIFDEN
jgi:hypothetical protein